ncbi:hypothetical protein [Paenibacillus mendelii]|uniref:DUF4240 domain-containing protein n=1 Tax=Paenibacillus mendelii TaxID=206163 RepID=A0ABV6JC73_9BACL|nr:hypothetical protein [Paenibacillus mendelii]MCQ6564106.1 hypothetical protein [Paenibacillus mendelii]
METGLLLKWEQEHSAINRTIDGFWNTFRSWKKENKNEYHDLFIGKLDEDFIFIDVVSISLKQYYDRDGAAIFCSLRLHYLKTMIGTYDMEFLLDGTIADDYLSFEERTTLHRMLAADKYGLHFARKAIAEGVEEEVIKNITGLEKDFIAMLKRKSLS